jgi:hypothetical protein
LEDFGGCVSERERESERERDAYSTARQVTRSGHRRCRKLELEQKNFPCVEFYLNSFKVFIFCLTVNKIRLHLNV